MKTIADITYVEYDGITLELDIHLPEGDGPFPLVIGIPGGGWRNCDKAGAPTYLCDIGIAVAGVNYRVSSVATAPANLEDCLTAIRWLRTHAGEYNLDTERFAVYGSSAGGHLAALVGSWPQVEGEVSTKVNAVFDMCGPTDLTRIAIPDIAAKFEALYEVTSLYMGGPVEENLELARRLSPLTYVSPESPPILIAHSRYETVVPVEESEIYHEALLQAGVDTTLKVVDADTHSVPFEAIKDDIIAFFRRTLNHPA